MANLLRPVRSLPIRLFLGVMLVVPLVSLLGLWGLAASNTIPAAISDHHFTVGASSINGPAVSALTINLPLEQGETYVWLLGGRRASEAPLLATRKVVDGALPGSESALQVERNLLTTSQGSLDTLLADLRGLNAIRKSVDSGQLSATAAFQAYSAVIDAQNQTYYAETVDRGGSLQASAIGGVDVTYSFQMVDREVTLVDGALLVSRGTMTPAARQLFIDAMANRRRLLTTGLTLLPASFRASYLTIDGSPMYQQYLAMESQIAASTGNGPIPVDPQTWNSVSGQYIQALITTENSMAKQFETLSQSHSNQLVAEAVMAGGIGLLAVVISIGLLVWFGRKVTRDMTRLHTSVREMAEERLPRVVDRLTRGEDVDVAAESPPPGTSRIKEISQIARSFSIVAEAAVVAAVEQARLHKGVNQVFLNISMRSQSLLHRQLGMLDSMERRTSDPEALGDLFRLDHLTTRMRRHAEGLIILSGSTPGRGWRDPVPVVDVLRAAVAEVEDYVRVDVVSESRDLVAGDAVHDVIHLVAELIENATVFSPPNTRIEVRADRVGTGLVAEIEDRGLGIGAEELAEINLRLATPPEFDLANSEQLGLFVVSRLAARRKVRVALRQSIYGGTTAVVVLPFGVIVREEEASQARRPAEASAVPESAGSLVAAGEFGATGRPTVLSDTSGRRADAEVAANGGHDRPSARADQFILPWEFENATPWPDAWHRGALGTEPHRPIDAPGAAPSDSPLSSSPLLSPLSSSHLGMPIRVPQASLAPQLRDRPDSGPQALVHDVPAIDDRSPEATRDLMITMQQGWQRGRVDDLDAPLGAPTEGNDREDGNGAD